ncbi:cytochrome P450 [Diaporthe sp. PMI_573]|nr:cytochrome P450 [Diaporthaceae sp. PMI_573]
MDGALRMGNLFVICLAVTLTIWIIAGALYNVFFHPLRTFPGPLLWRAFRLPFVIKAIQGRLAFDMLSIHEQYGPVVRIAPNELAFAHPSAWRDIMGGKQDFAKWDEYYKVQHHQATNIMFAPDEEHARMRRAAGIGFSDRVLREMEPPIQNSIGLLIRRLMDQCKSPEVDGKIDMSKWYNFTAFDLIGNLVMGESYHCLENADYHPWVRPIYQVTHISAIISSLGHYPWFKSTLLRLFRPIISRKILNHQAYARAKLTKRMKVNRNDLVQAMLDIDTNNEKEMDKLFMNTSVFIVAGSETTATVLSGVTFLLLSQPDKLARLTDEVRNAFESEEDITMAKASQLEYMLACLEETLRLYPPVPIGMPRIVPKGGRIISGSYVPENVCVTFLLL